VLLILREPLAPTGPADGLGGPSPAAVLAGLVGRRRGRGDRTQVPAAARRAAEARLVRRLGEAIDLLAPAGITVTPLDAGQATAVLSATCDPDSLIPPTAAMAGAGEVITGVITTAPDDTDHPDPGRRAADEDDVDDLADDGTSDEDEFADDVDDEAIGGRTA
jgi:hypothetical protein